MWWKVRSLYEQFYNLDQYAEWDEAMPYLLPRYPIMSQLFMELLTVVQDIVNDGSKVKLPDDAIVRFECITGAVRELRESCMETLSKDPRPIPRVMALMHKIRSTMRSEYSASRELV